MHPLLSLAIYLSVVFLGGALLAPWLYWLVQWSALYFPVLQDLAATPFQRYVNRSVMVLALAGLWPLLRSLGLRSWREMGLENPKTGWSGAGRGFALGFGSLAAVALIVLAIGAREINTNVSAHRLVEKLSAAALTAALVAVVEEVLFRGALFGVLRKTSSLGVALAASSGIYALVHFVSRPQLSGEVSWVSGLILLPQMFQEFLNLERVVPGFFALTLVGGMLAVAYERTGTLFFSIGLHAGWIFWVKSYGLLTREAVGMHSSLWGSRKVIDGWVALGILALCFFAVVKLTEPDEPGLSA